MTLKISPKPLHPTIDIPNSKSYANRLLIVAARLGGGRELKDLPSSDDVIYLVNALEQVGLKLERRGNDLVFHNSFPECEIETTDSMKINVGEGGTTARFLLALLSLGKNKYILEMRGLLFQRPWTDLIQVLQNAKVKIEWVDERSLSVQGPIDLTLLPIEISCHETTQFITSLQLSFFKERKFFIPLHLNSSASYWQMTLNCLEDFKVKSIPKDWSSASYPMVLAAVRGESILFKGLYEDPLQADSLIFNILEERGSLEKVKEGMMVKSLALKHPLDIDGSQCLDLIPTLAFLAMNLEGESIIRKTKGLIHKESNRQDEILRILEAVGCQAHLSESGSLHIWGIHRFGMLSLKPAPDHRMVMMAALMLLANQGGELSNEKCVNKSFRNFFEIVAPTLK